VAEADDIEEPKKANERWIFVRHESLRGSEKGSETFFEVACQWPPEGRSSYRYRWWLGKVSRYRANRMPVFSIWAEAHAAANGVSGEETHG
jgi:hypothetical protein